MPCSGMNNLFYLFDRSGAFLERLSLYLPERDCYDRGNFYLGLSTIFLAMGYLFLKKSSTVRSAGRTLFICMMMIWIASGTTSILDNLVQQVKSINSHLSCPEHLKVLVSTVLLIPLVLLISRCILFRKWHRDPASLMTIFLGVSVTLVILYIPVFSILRHIPIMLIADFRINRHKLA